METVKKSKLNYINYMRAIAILIIVAGHTYLWGAKTEIIFKANTYMFKGGTLHFVFIAGFLFQYLAYKFDYVKYLKTKFINVIMPYFVTLLPIALIFAFTCKDPNNFLINYPPGIKFINAFINGRIVNAALWFIPMITVFFITAPILLKLKKNKGLWYFILIASFFCTILTSRPGFSEGLYKNLNVTLLEWNCKYLQHMVLGRFLYFLPSYLLGMEICSVIEKYGDKIKENIKTILFVSTSVWVYFFILQTYFIKKMNNDIGNFALIFVLLSLFIYLEDYIVKNKPLDKVLNFIADYSFGIFFIHLYPFYLIKKHILYRTYSQGKYFLPATTTDSFASFIVAIEQFLISLLGSILVLFIIKWILTKIGIKNTRMFIGVGTAPKKALPSPEQTEQTKQN